LPDHAMTFSPAGPPTYEPLSSEERGAIASYLEELHHFLTREEAEHDPSQRLIPF